jgi:ribosomal-protein-alanine N-acetyltransferase
VSRSSPRRPRWCPSNRRRLKGRPSEPDGPRLRPFASGDGPTVLAWVTSDDEARGWASLPARPTDDGVFARWHAEAGVLAYVLELDGEPVGYGEVWEDHDEDEAELARLIIDPSRRRRGLGRSLVALLLAEARQLGWWDVWLRVASYNDPALGCYAAAGFTRAAPDKEGAFNVGQPVDFVWMRAPAAPPDVNSGSA